MMKMETESSSETSVNSYMTVHPIDSDLHCHCHDNLRPIITVLSWKIITKIISVITKEQYKIELHA